MNSKIAFYTALAAFIGLSVYFGSQVFSPSREEPSQVALKKERKSSAQKKNTNKSKEVLENVPKKSSIWANEFEAPKSAGKIDLKKSAEKEQATSLLKELYQFPDKTSFVEKAKDLMNQFPDAAEFPAALADYHFNEGNLPEAEIYLKETLKREPSYTLAKNTLGDVQMRLGNFQKAKETFAEIFESGTDNLYAYQGFLGASAILGEEESAKTLLLERYKADPSKTNLALSIADIYFVEGNEAERDQILQTAKQKDPDHPMLNHVLASDAFLKGNFEDSIQYGQKAVDFDIDNQRKFSMLKTMLAAAEDLKDQDQIAKIQQQLDELRFKR
ncbi:MAG: tetratricopeptide repeat protein [Bdellovibrionota bacterium]